MDCAAARRRADRRIALFATPLYLAAALAIVACAPHAAPAPVDEPLIVTDARICAAVAVYALAKSDAYDQRAAVANTVLNRFKQLGHVPDCGGPLSDIVGRGLDEYRWRSALDAVDAIQSGSYALPLACVRADTVVPPTVPAGSPLYRAAARTQCVLSGLAFVEAQA